LTIFEINRTALAPIFVMTFRPLPLTASLGAGRVTADKLEAMLSPSNHQSVFGLEVPRTLGGGFLTFL